MPRGRGGSRHRGAGKQDTRHAGLGLRDPSPVTPIKNIDFWFRINGVDVANTNSSQSMTSTSEREVVAFSQTLSLQDGDYFELMFAVNDLSVILNTITASAFGPAAPSVILSVVEI